MVLVACGTRPQQPAAHPDWSYNSVVYEMNVRQYTPEGTLAEAARHLPRLQEMGVDVVWLMPVYPIGVKERKGTLGSYYAISDYEAVNPEFGTLEDFDRFLAEAHRLGLRVILDWVANHTSPDARWIEERPADWYVRDSLGNTIVQYDWTDIAKLDYGNADMDSHWARLGDKVTLRYVEEWEYVDPDTGIAYSSVEDVPAGANWVAQPVQYRDVEYEVAALVTVPSAFSYRYYGSDEFILNDQTFIQDTGTDSVMYYAFDTTDEANAAMESFLQDYTENVNPQFDYESKALYAAEFEGMRSMFQLCGGALSFIVGLVGVLNFFNAILTGIIARKREFAVLQSIGMTGKQLKAMLVYEGLFYALGAAGISLILTLILGPVAFKAVGSLFWFFTYRLTLAPFLVVIPVFALLGALVPLAVYRSVSKSTIVERLREVD